MCSSKNAVQEEIFLNRMKAVLRGNGASARATEGQAKADKGRRGGSSRPARDPGRGGGFARSPQAWLQELDASGAHSPYPRSAPAPSSTRAARRSASQSSHRACIPLPLLSLSAQFSTIPAMAAATMAASSVVALVAAPGAAASPTSFSRFSSVKMAPLRTARRFSVVAMAQPNETKKGDMKQQISESIANAQKTCEDDPTSAPCAVAWDEVEELSAEDKHQRDRLKANSDPLETYCADNPETDECRVYED